MFCEESGISFDITDADRAFYQKMGLPVPVLCADERWRRRLVFRNERNLFRRKCDATGRSIISVHDEDAPFPVYSQEYWYGDKWDALSFGREVDFSRPFFEQFGWCTVRRAQKVRSASVPLAFRRYSGIGYKVYGIKNIDCSLRTFVTDKVIPYSLYFIPYTSFRIAGAQ